MHAIHPAARRKTDPGNTDSPTFYRPQSNGIGLFEHAYRNRLPLMIKGPTGGGKTRFVQYLGARLDRPLYTLAYRDDLTAADPIGRHLIGDGGTFWSDGPLTRAVRNGAICYRDMPAGLDHRRSRPSGCARAGRCAAAGHRCGHLYARA